MPVFSGTFQNVIIGVSTGRTATTELAGRFDRVYDQVRALHEPPPSRKLRKLSNMYLAGKVAKEDLIRAYADARQALFRNIPQPVYIELNPFLHGFLDVLPELFDQPKILHIVRDPRRYVPSHLNHGILSKRTAKGWVVRLFPYYMTRSDYLEPRSARKWRHMSHIERVAYRWRAINERLERGGETYGDRYRRVRFEDLIQPDGAALREIVAWMGLPFEEDLLRPEERQRNRPRRKLCPDWEAMNLDQQHAILDHCGDLMARYGYAEDEDAALREIEGAAP